MWRSGVCMPSGWSSVLFPSFCTVHMKLNKTSHYPALTQATVISFNFVAKMVSHDSWQSWRLVSGKQTDHQHSSKTRRNCHSVVLCVLAWPEEDLVQTFIFSSIKASTNFNTVSVFMLRKNNQFCFRSSGDTICNYSSSERSDIRRAFWLEEVFFFFQNTQQKKKKYKK